ncbi:MAG: substrate-binding domain-containing protein, partial [Chloroflexota bacterium]
MKRYKWLILALTFAMFFAACGGGATEEPAEEPVEDTTSEDTSTEDEDMEEDMEEEMEEEMMEEGDGSIWVLLPDSASSARWETDDRRFFEEAFDAAGVEYNIVNAEGDAQTQQAQAEQAITAGAKVILIV